MGWAAIVAAIIELVGPLLQDWLKDCTKEKLVEAGDDLPGPEAFGSEGEAAAALFDRAIANQRRVAYVRRAALRRLKAVAVQGKKLRRSPLTPDELAEGRDIVGGVRGE